MRYTVPQRITERKDVTLYFRVSDVCEKVRLNVTCGDEVLLTKRMPKVAPGEMQSVVLKGDRLPSSGELNVSLEVLA